MKLKNVIYNLSVQFIATKVGKFLKLYGESLQALVQGYREVTMDSTNSFKFDKDKNGEELTVQDKLDRYEQRLRQATNSGLSAIKKKK